MVGELGEFLEESKKTLDAEFCTSCTISEILGAQRAQNAGQGNLTDH
jgi:hypothetical protein